MVPCYLLLLLWCKVISRWLWHIFPIVSCCLWKSLRVYKQTSDSYLVVVYHKREIPRTLCYFSFTSSTIFSGRPIKTTIHNLPDPISVLPYWSSSVSCFWSSSERFNGDNSYVKVNKNIQWIDQEKQWEVCFYHLRSFQSDMASNNPEMVSSKILHNVFIFTN